jgi:hypothetical protein
LPEDLKDEYHAWGRAKDISKERWKSTKTVFTKSYDKEIRKMKQDKKLDFKLLGFLTFLATYTHYEDNTLRNSDGTYMSKEDIIRETELSEATVRRNLDFLIKEEIMWKSENELEKGKNKYYLSPQLFYKGVDINREIKEFFNAK